MNKETALSQYLKTEESNIKCSEHEENLFIVYDDDEYLVLTDEEADRAVYDYIRESIWAFRPEFLESHISSLDCEDIKNLVGDRCEDINETLFKLIDDFDDFVEDAVSSDGRGHFLAGYDHEEMELDGGFYAYRR